MAINWIPWRAQRQQQLCWQLLGSMGLSWAICVGAQYVGFQLRPATTRAPDPPTMAMAQPPMVLPTPCLKHTTPFKKMPPKVTTSKMALPQLWHHLHGWPRSAPLTQLAWQPDQMVFTGRCMTVITWQALLHWLHVHPQATMQWAHHTTHHGGDYVITLPLL